MLHKYLDPIWIPCGSKSSIVCFKMCIFRWNNKPCSRPTSANSMVEGDAMIHSWGAAGDGRMWMILELFWGFQMFEVDAGCLLTMVATTYSVNSFVSICFLFFLLLLFVLVFVFFVVDFCYSFVFYYLSVPLIKLSFSCKYAKFVVKCAAFEI